MCVILYRTSRENEINDLFEWPFGTHITVGSVIEWRHWSFYFEGVCVFLCYYLKDAQR